MTKNKILTPLIFVVVTMFVVLSCFLYDLGGIATDESVVSPSPTVSLPIVEREVTPAPETVPTVYEIATELPIFAPTPDPNLIRIPEGEVEYVGYWLKVVKDPDKAKSWRMNLYYQDGQTLTLVTYFCVRGSDNNTPDGFYFVAIDRPTKYPNARGGYSETTFSHNLGIKLSPLGNWYLHSAPWNTEGEFGCPTRNTGGCVNMRDVDFNALVEGDLYTNPFTNQVIDLPDLGMGTPVIVVASPDYCTFLGECMDHFQCYDGQTCFKYYTCATCDRDYVAKWEQIASLAPNLRTLIR